MVHNSGDFCRLIRKADRHSRSSGALSIGGSLWVRVVLSPAQEFESYARECIRLATLTNDPPVVEQLIDMAREWMNAALEAEGGSISVPAMPPAASLSRIHR